MLKIAIIEENKEYSRRLKELSDNFSWQIDFFHNSSEFGIADLKDYSVIIADQNLSSIKGRDLLKSVSKKTSAELFLMSNENNFLQEDVANNSISGLMNKEDLNDIIEQLKYIDSKIRINQIMEKENSSFDELVYSNGYTLKEEKDGIILLEINEVLSGQSLKNIEKKLNKKCKCVLFFSSGFSSLFLSTLTLIYKIVQRKEGTMVFYSENSNVIKAVETCNLNKLFKVFNSENDAIKFFSN